MNWLVRVFMAAAAFAALLLVIGLLLPGAARVERSVVIDRPVASLYTVLANPAAYAEWAPWLRLDPLVQTRLDGPDREVGARLRWSSTDPRVGSGAMTVMSATPYSRVELATATDGWGASSTVYDIAPAGAGADVTMTFQTRFGLNVIRRFVGLSFERRVGADYERALEALRVYAEGLPADDFSDVRIQTVELDAIAAAFASGRVRGDSEAQAAAFADAQERLENFLADEGLQRVGPIIAVTEEWNPPLWAFKAAAAYAGSPRPVTPGARVGFMLIPEGPAYKHVLEGDPSGVQRSVGKLRAYAAARRETPLGPAYEMRVTDRTRVLPSDQITELYLPLDPSADAR